jgi:hypothetical protein
MPANERRVEYPSIMKGDGIRPEHVMAAGAEHAQATDDLVRPAHGGAVLRMAQNTNEPVFREGTGRPSVRALIRKPIVGKLVMDMVGIEKRDKHVDIEQRDSTYGTHPSSLSSLTSRTVGRGAVDARRGSTGTPFRTFRPGARRAGANPFRASSDKTFPAVVPRVAAISFAACRTSSSRSSVVRIAAASRITHQMSRPGRAEDPHGEGLRIESGLSLV